jgi:hypothetical protein
MSEQAQEGRFISVPEICAQLDCQQVTFRRACERHNIRIIRLSPKKHVLSADDYALLLKRAKESR